MKRFRNIASWWREARRKRRVVMQHASSGEEEWYMHLSPAGLFSGFMALVLVLFILILILVAYTPVLEFLPGYRTEATRSRENLVSNIMRLDSMERVIADMLTYNENIALVLDGRSPVVRSRLESDTLKLDKTLVETNAADSALRAQMEGEGPYSLGGSAASRRSVREAVEMITPVEGIITRPFNAKEQHHMADVQALFRLCARIGLTASSAVILLSLLAKHLSWRAFRRTLISILAAVTAVIILACIDFNSLFVLFHKVAFTNDLWLLNPQTDLLIRLMPIEFFISYAAIIGGIWLTGMAGLLVISTIRIRNESPRPTRLAKATRCKSTKVE